MDLVAFVQQTEWSGYYGTCMIPTDQVHQFAMNVDRKHKSAMLVTEDFPYMTGDLTFVVLPWLCDRTLVIKGWKGAW